MRRRTCSFFLSLELLDLSLYPPVRDLMRWEKLRMGVRRIHVTLRMADP
jgi:hypothetical protein